MRELEKVVMLRIVDNKWMEHLDHMDMLREGINLRAYGQRSPLVEYKIEALAMFEEMEGAIQDQIASTMYHVAVVQNEAPPPQVEQQPAQDAQDVPSEQAVDEQPAQVEQADAESTKPAEPSKPAETPQQQQIRSREAEAAVRREQAKVEDRLQTARASHGDETSPAESKKRAKTADGKKIGRNSPCPCGSGKKYKNCCGRNR